MVTSIKSGSPLTRGRIYAFKQVFSATILISDAVCFTRLHDVKNAVMSFGSAEYYPLDNDKFALNMQQGYVKLYEKQQYKVLSKLDKPKKLTKPEARRANTQFINRFAVHGKTARAKKFFATAMRSILFIAANHTINALNFEPSMFILASMSDVTKLQKKTFAAIGTPKMPNNIADNLLGKQTELYSNIANVYSTEFFFNRLKQMAPLYSTLPRRVDKARYKNMRGKIKKYTLAIKQIPKEKAVVYALFYLKVQ